MYTVIVGNIGKVGEFLDLEPAKKRFWAYRSMSVKGYGRTAGEPVYLMHDGEVIDSHEGTN